MKTMHIYCDTKSVKLKKSILEEMSKNVCFFDAIFEIVNNIYLRKLKLKLSPSERKKFKKYLNVLDKIHQHPKSIVKKKKLIKQSGGFLPLILPLLASVITGIVTNAVSKKSDSDSS